VKVPSDNPPGDCARHGEKSAELYEGLGFTVERHKVPEALVCKIPLELGEIAGMRTTLRKLLDALATADDRG